MKVVFTSDVLKIDDRARDLWVNPQRINIDWIRALFGPLVSRLFPAAESEVYYGDSGGFESLRWRVFNALGLSLCSDSWARLYEGGEFYDDYVVLLEEGFPAADLVVGCELPPYLVRYLSERSIPYIDFTVHPIRFLPDYVFGVRSNWPGLAEKLERARISDEVIADFARVSAARTVRVARVLKENIPDNSAIFMGQIEVDSSLIKGGRIASQDDIETALIQLRMAYQKVYFKAHPHCSTNDKLKALLGRIKGCEWIDVNAYDALGLGAFSLVATLSSGSAIEAKYFGCKTKFFLGQKEHFDYECADKTRVYYPIWKDVFRYEFWNAMLHDGPSEEWSLPDPFEGAVKFSLNMKWGR